MEEGKGDGLDMDRPRDQALANIRTEPSHHGALVYAMPLPSDFAIPYIYLSFNSSFGKSSEKNMCFFTTTMQGVPPLVEWCFPGPLIRQELQFFGNAILNNLKRCIGHAMVI